MIDISRVRTNITNLLTMLRDDKIIHQKDVKDIMSLLVERMKMYKPEVKVVEELKETKMSYPEFR